MICAGSITVLLGALAWLYLADRPVLRARLAARVAGAVRRRATSARRSAAALRRGLTLHPRQPQHARSPR